MELIGDILGLSPFPSKVAESSDVLHQQAWGIAEL